MKMHNWILAIGGIAALGVAALGGLAWEDHGQAWLCERSGGKWGSAVGACTPRDCYARGDCGYWSNPAARCDRLTAGDTIAEVYFQLGNPDAVDETRYHWGMRKGYGADAVIENGKLKTLDCRLGLPGP